MATAAERLMALFDGNQDAHGTHGEPNLEGDRKWSIKKTARTLREPVTLEMWEKHLKGTCPLGVIPIKNNSTCVWGSIDVDQYDMNLVELVRKVERAKLPLVPCRSKSGGLHLFVFLRHPEPASDLQVALRDVAAKMGLAGSEIFPKQTELLSERGDMGNWIVMPYFGSTYGGKIKEQVGLKKTGAEQTVEEFLDLAQETLTTASDLMGRAAPRQSRVAPTGAPFSDGPPCLQNMAEAGFPEGGRNNALFMIGVYYKKAFGSDWESKIEEANQTWMKPPLTTDEVNATLRQLRKKDYLYTCKTEPMASHCDSLVCRGRRHGVGVGSIVPNITGVRRQVSEPVLWFVDVDGQTLELSTEQFQKYTVFQIVAMEKTGATYQSMKQSDWLTLVQKAMQSCIIQQAPVDASAAEKFRELLEEFLTNRTRGDRKEDLLVNKPWHDEEHSRHYFRLMDFLRFLERERVRDFPRGNVCRRLETMGGGPSFFNIGGKGLNVWWIPAETVQGTPEVEPAQVKGMPI